MKRNICKSITLYNSRKYEIDYDLLLNSFLKVFDKFNIRPNFVGLVGKGYPKQIIDFEKGLKKLTSQKFSNIESINLIYNTPNSDAPAYDWLFSIIVNNFDSLEIFIGADINEFDFDALDSLSFLRDLLTVEYGYIYKREFTKKPDFYAWGVTSEFITEDEEKSISCWMKDSFSKRSYKEGKLRDLYLSNFINQKHLEYPINDRLRLLDFIKSKETENEPLLEITGGLFLWNIKPDNLLRYREELAKSDILICYNKNVMPTIL